MRYQLQQHVTATLGAKQGVFTKAFEEPLLERFWRQNPVASGIDGCVSRNSFGKVLSHFLVSYVTVQSVISDSLKALWQDMLHHTSDESQDSESFVFNLSCFVVPIPVPDEFPVISFNSSYRDRRRYDILGQILSQTLPARRNFSGLQKGDKALGIICPGSVDIFFNVRIGNVFSEHIQKMKLPFFVHHIVWDVADRLPFAFFIKSSGGHEDMKMWVVISGSSCGLQYDNITDVEFLYPCAGLENIFDTSMSCPHELTEQLPITKEPDTKALRHSQDDMSIGYTWQQPSSDEVRPSVGVDLCTGKAEAGLACESNSAYFSAVAATVLYKAHFFWVATVKHFLDSFDVVRAVKTWIKLYKGVPVIIEYLLECIFVYAFHGRSLQKKIAELAG